MESIDFANIDFSTIGESFKVVSQHMKVSSELAFSVEQIADDYLGLVGSRW